MKIVMICYVLDSLNFRVGAESTLFIIIINSLIANLVAYLSRVNLSLLPRGLHIVWSANGLGLGVR